MPSKKTCKKNQVLSSNKCVLRKRSSPKTQKRSKSASMKHKRSKSASMKYKRSLRQKRSKSASMKHKRSSKLKRSKPKTKSIRKRSSPVARRNKALREYKGVVYDPYSKNVNCAVYSKDKCGSVSPNCGWVRKRGCVAKKGVRKDVVYQGPMLPEGY